MASRERFLRLLYRLVLNREVLRAISGAEVSGRLGDGRNTERRVLMVVWRRIAKAVVGAPPRARLLRLKLLLLLRRPVML